MPTPAARRARSSKGLILPAIVGLVIVPALLLTVALEIGREFRRGRELRAAVNHSYEERLQMQTVFSLMQDAETGQRGYIITGQPRFLEPYAHALESLGRERQRLRALRVNDPTGTSVAASQAGEELDRLDAKIDAKLAYMRANIATRDNQGAAAATAMVGDGQGKRIMDEIRVYMARMANAEGNALAERIAADAERTRHTERLTLTLFLTLGLLLFGAFVLILLQGRGRQRLLEQVELTAKRMTAIFDSAQDGLLTFNRSGTVESINRAGQAMFGYGPAETTGRDAALLFDIPEDNQLFLDRLGGGRDLRQGLTREFTARRKDGSTFPAEVSLGRFDLANGAHVVASVRDMTERRRVEQMKSEFVSTVSHELRTPLTSIAGSLGLLVGGAAGALPERAARLVGIAHANCQRLVRLINDILDVEKIESGQMTFNIEPLDVSELARRAMEAMQGLAGELGVTLALDAPQAAMARGDADRLTQVVTNLLSNAAKFSPKGGVVETSVRREGARIRLSVRDHGSGVPEAFRERIFSKFAQADGSDTRRLGGTGLGLVICREIVERHGGRISFDSPPGEGATFHVDLPLLEEGGASGGKVRRVLICEDDPDAAAVLAEMTAELGLAADVVGTLAAADTALSGLVTYSALLLDLRLPDGNGLDLLKRLRARPETRALPVLIVSGDPGSSPQSLDVLDWLQKPVDIARLNAALAQARRGDDARLLVLHVEDDPDVRQLVADTLEAHCEVVAADSLKAARRLLKDIEPQLAILDVALGDGSGLDLLPDLKPRGRAPVPVIVFSAQSIDDEQVVTSVDAILTKSRTTLDELSERVQRLAGLGTTEKGAVEKDA